MVIATKSCALDGRKAFRSEAEAKSVVFRMRAKGSDVRAFRCPQCGSWHIGTLAARRLSA